MGAPPPSIMASWTYCFKHWAEGRGNRIFTEDQIVSNASTTSLPTLCHRCYVTQQSKQSREGNELLRKAGQFKPNIDWFLISTDTSTPTHCLNHKEWKSKRNFKCCSNANKEQRGENNFSAAEVKQTNNKSVEWEELEVKTTGTQTSETRLLQVFLVYTAEFRVPAFFVSFCVWLWVCLYLHSLVHLMLAALSKINPLLSVRMYQTGTRWIKLLFP